MRRGLCTAAAVLVALVIAPLGRADAAPVYFTPADLEGDRSVGDGLVVDPDGEWPDAAISWEITPVPGEALLRYTYTFTNFSQPAISHITLDLSPDAVDPFDADAVFDVSIQEDGTDLDFDVEFGDIDGIDSAVKFEEIEVGDDVTLVLSFLSNRNPVWGDIFVKGGQQDLTNTGFGDRVSTNVNDYIAVPNSVIPTPTAALGGLALLGVLAARRPRRCPRQ